jgi:cell division protein FtsZ
VTGHADANANVIFGAVIDESLGDDVRVTVIATGFGGGRPRRRRPESVQTTPSSSSESAAPSFDPRPRTEDSEIDVPSFLRD